MPRLVGGRVEVKAVGHIRRIYRYPVKSMAPEILSEVSIGWNGLDGDRRFAFRRTDSSSGFPWLTGRNVAQLLRYRPYFAQSEGHSGETLRVITPDGEDLEVSSPDLLDRLTVAHGGAVDLSHVDRGIFDEAHVSVISSQSIAALQQELKTHLDERRFRPNLVIESVDAAPFAEEAWVGRVLVFGEGSAAPSVNVTHRDKRCVMINLDPDTTASDATVLKAVVSTRGSCAGVYGAVVRAGAIREGDPIYCRDA